MKLIIFEVKQRAETITQSIRLTETQYGSWKAINIGTADVTVNGVTLAPKEGLEERLRPEERWTEPIDISNVQPGGAIRLLRNRCTPKVIEVAE